MHCVICKRGTVQSGTVQAELGVGTDHLMVPVEAEVCDECGEAYYSTEALRHLEQVRENFLRKVIAPPSVGHVAAHSHPPEDALREQKLLTPLRHTLPFPYTFVGADSLHVVQYDSSLCLSNAAQRLAPADEQFSSISQTRVTKASCTPDVPK